MASILDTLDRHGEVHPHKLLYSYLDLSGNSIESYSYASFLRRTKAIAGHLRKDGRFAAGDRLLLAYPPGLEMICAFFGCVRAGLIPVPVYPPSSRGFQSAMYKMVHIAKDCQASGVLTSGDYYASLKTNLARSGVSTSGVDVDYISGLPWIVTEEFVDLVSDEPFPEASKILFLQYTSGSTMEPKGVVVTHENILQTSPLVIDHPEPVVVSWIPRCKVARRTVSLLRISFSDRFCGSMRLPPIVQRQRLRPISHTTIACAPADFPRTVWRSAISARSRC
jgi:acyl-CoA synthetase (AMP-forming)/AMP-acid ligase II